MGRSLSAGQTGLEAPRTGAAETPGVPDERLLALKRVAIVPALNEEDTIARVIDELRSFDPGFEIVVVDDGSVDATAEIAAGRGVHVLQLPFNIGIGGAVQTGFRYAYENGFELAVQVDGDGQHDASQLPSVVQPILSGDADLVVGSRFAGSTGYRPSALRLAGIRVFAWITSALIRQRVTDTTSGFRAVNRHGIALFARDYPHDYPEVEATVMAFKHRLRLREVPVEMRERLGGQSSITALSSAYYMIKVLLALFVGLFRRQALPREER
jgi:glycosyltransferase involved in cell wall biosynthesis